MATTQHSVRRVPCSGHEDDDTLVSKCSSSLNLLSVCTCLAIETASLHTLAWLGLHTCTLTDMSMSMFVHMCVVCVVCMYVCDVVPWIVWVVYWGEEKWQNS